MKAALDAKTADRTVGRLQHRAERAEEYAAAALVVARGAVEEAHAAILAAAAARADADDAEPVGPTKRRRERAVGKGGDRPQAPRRPGPGTPAQARPLRGEPCSEEVHPHVCH